MPVIGVATLKQIIRKTVSNIVEVKSEEHLQLPYVRKEQNLVRA